MVEMRDVTVNTGSGGSKHSGYVKPDKSPSLHEL